MSLILHHELLDEGFLGHHRFVINNCYQDTKIQKSLESLNVEQKTKKYFFS